MLAIESFYGSVVFLKDNILTATSTIVERLLRALTRNVPAIHLQLLDYLVRNPWDCMSYANSSIFLVQKTSKSSSETLLSFPYLRDPSLL